MIFGIGPSSEEASDSLDTPLTVLLSLEVAAILHYLDYFYWSYYCTPGTWIAELFTATGDPNINRRADVRHVAVLDPPANAREPLPVHSRALVAPPPASPIRLRRPLQSSSRGRCLSVCLSICLWLACECVFRERNIVFFLSARCAPLEVL